LGTIEALMTFWIGSPHEEGALKREEISNRLEAMVAHTKAEKCPLCPLRETKEAEDRFLETTKLYMLAAHRHLPSNLLDIAIDRAEDGVSDSSPDWPFVDLIAALIVKKI
jgi:hypothetical protein